MNVSKPTERQTNQSSIKLLQIMECLAEQRTPMRVQDLAKKVNMTQATVLRYLYALQDAKYIYQDTETSRYALTWRVCRLSENLNSFLSLRNITTPFINSLANTLSLGVCLVVNQNDECMYLDCIDNPNSPTLQRIGKKAPLHATGSGKVLLSQYTDLQLKEYMIILMKIIQTMVIKEASEEFMVQFQKIQIFNGKSILMKMGLKENMPALTY